jgi:DNA-binding beta-propeller fold protein YncE
MSATVARCRQAALVFVVILCATFVPSLVRAQFLMMPDSTNNLLVLFDPNNGSVVNPNFFGLAAGTPVHAMQVGSEIWVSEQIGDRISRWDFNGNALAPITGQMDNVRGMELANNTVYLCNDGTNNGAPGAALRMFDTAGNSLGSFPTPASSPFGILDHQGGLLVSSDAANDDVHRYSYTGTSLGTFHNTTSLNFAEQMDHATNGDVLVAGFSSNNIARLDPATGALLSSIPASGARGVWQLGNGNILWTNGSGAHVFDVTTQQSTQVYTGGGRFIDALVIPEPASGAAVMLAAGALLAHRRKRA